MSFEGAKLALYLGERLAVILRDDFEGLPFAGHWDLPGGGREGDETPLECALRECREELGLDVPEAAIEWERAFRERGTVRWFFVARLPESVVGQVILGDEGQRWEMMTEEDFLNHSKAVPSLQFRLGTYLDEQGEGVRKAPRF